MYRSHLAAMTVPVHSPFWQRKEGRPVWITPREYALVAAVQGGWKGNQRALARALGYSIAGLNEAIRTLSGVGVLARSTLRGCKGWTRLRIQAGVHVLRNVRERSRHPEHVGRITTSYVPEHSIGVGSAHDSMGVDRAHGSDRERRTQYHPLSVGAEAHT